MNAFLEPKDDGLPMRNSGPWVREKLDYLQRYIDVFETAMRRKWPSRSYIDLFAGPGKCRLPDKSVLLGSPLLALNARYPFTSYYFVDCSNRNIEALRQRCSLYRDPDCVELMCEDADNAVQAIVQRLHTNSSESSLNLAFLDPEGLELTWDCSASDGIGISPRTN
jgi:three-Cys-motif partner protein